MQDVLKQAKTPIERDELNLRALDALIANCEKSKFPFVSVYIFERTKLIDNVLKRLAALPAGGRVRGSGGMRQLIARFGWAGAAALAAYVVMAVCMVGQLCYFLWSSGLHWVALLVVVVVVIALAREARVSSLARVIQERKSK